MVKSEFSYYRISQLHSFVVAIVSSVITGLYILAAIVMLSSPYLFSIRGDLYNYNSIAKIILLSFVSIFIGAYVFRQLALNTLRAKFKFITLCLIAYIVTCLLTQDLVLILLYSLILLVAVPLIMHLTYRPIVDLE